jgi:hypothetical protein
MKFVDDLRRAIDGFVAEMKAQNRLLKDEEQEYQEAFRTLTEGNRREVVQIVNRVERRRRAFLATLRQEEEDQDETEAVKYLQFVDEVKDEFMGKEMALVDMVSEMRRAYENVLFDDMMGAINEKISSFFNVLRVAETEYHDKVTEICMRLWERFNQGEAVQVNDEVRSILVDKDALVATITQSHEHRTTMLYRRQEEIGGMYKTKIEQMEAAARQTDLERNRKRITEISNYCQSLTRVLHMDDGDDD